MSRWISAKSIGKFLILVPVLLLVALACGDDAKPTPTGAAIPPTPTATTVPVATPTPTAVPAAVPEGRLVIGVDQLGTESPSPWLQTSQSKKFMRLLYDVTIGSKDDGSLNRCCGAVEDWELSPDSTSWTFRFRKGIQFHNGDTLTAEDSKFSMQMIMSDEGQSTYKRNFVGRIDSLDDIVIVNPYEMVVNMNQAAPWFTMDLSDVVAAEGFIVPKSYTEGIGSAEFANRPVGSGPFKWVDQRVGEFLELEAVDYEHWREGVPKFKTVLYRIIPEETTMIAALKAGEIDIIPLARERVPDIEASGFNIFRAEGFLSVGLYFHGAWRESSVWNDKRIRKAWNLAINRQELCDSLLAGECKPASGVWFFPDVTEGMPDDLEPYPYDPVESRRLLAEAGYDGEEIKLHSFLRGNFPENKKYIEAMAGYLSAVGINAKVIPIEAVASGAMRRAFDLNNTHTSIPVDGRPMEAWISLLYVLLHTDGVVTVLHDPVMDNFIDTIRASADRAEVKMLFTEMFRYMHNEYKTMTVLDANIIMAASKKVTKWDLGKRPYDQNYLAVAVGR